jgi:hypothetical protein
MNKEKVSVFYGKISSTFSVEKYNEIKLNRAGEDEVFLNVKII